VGTRVEYRGAVSGGHDTGSGALCHTRTRCLQLSTVDAASS
jgi:hypothetical protein